MSWNASFIAIRRDYAGRFDELMHALCLEPPGDFGPIAWMDAATIHAPGRSVGVVDGWTVVCDPFNFCNLGDRLMSAGNSVWPVKVEEGLTAASRGTVAVGLLLAGTSGVYGFTLHEDGVQRRCRKVWGENVVKDLGTPPPQELAALREAEDEEERAFLLAAKFGLTFKQLEKTQFLRVTDGGD